MKLPQIELIDILERFTSAAQEIIEQHEDTRDIQHNPEVLLDAMNKLVDVLRAINEQDFSATGTSVSDSLPNASTLIGKDITELGNYGIQILSDMASIANTPSLKSACEQLQSLHFPFALWIARHDGELEQIDQVASTSTQLANQIIDSMQLADLCVMLGEIIDAVGMDIRNDLENMHPRRPWRVLNLNRGTVATRSHNPRAMEIAFRALTENLPEDAPDFFREGAEQMQAQNTPQPVREVMSRYYNEWCTIRKHLH